AEYEGIEYATLEKFEEAYAGEWDSEEAFAEDLASETMEIPKHLEFYIDYERLANDLFINDYYSAEGEGCKVYVFRRL
ncbi:MAG: antirestriction protein ArdA, partial [Candidatus Omnitrophica bacterium]|nr:antirestriction protein ArdA [Candidatus Omnitrophota bacterium]